MTSKGSYSGLEKTMADASIEDTYQSLLTLTDKMKHERFLPKSPVPELTDAEARMVALIYNQIGRASCRERV